MTTCNVYPRWDLETEEGYYAKVKEIWKKKIMGFNLKKIFQHWFSI